MDLHLEVIYHRWFIQLGRNLCSEEKGYDMSRDVATEGNKQHRKKLLVNMNLKIKKIIHRYNIIKRYSHTRLKNQNLRATIRIRRTNITSCYAWNIAITKNNFGTQPNNGGLG